MSLYTVSTSTTINALDVNQLVYILARQSGQSETGKYFLRGQSYANGANMGNYQDSLSRISTPVSVVIDEADQAHGAGNANAAVTANLTANGFLVYSSGVGVQTLWQVGGNTTINF